MVVYMHARVHNVNSETKVKPNVYLEIKNVPAACELCQRARKRFLRA